MKTVTMLHDFDYRAHPRKHVRFQAGVTYLRVIEAAADAIVEAGAGEVIDCDGIVTAGPVVDARDAWRR